MYFPSLYYSYHFHSLPSPLSWLFTHHPNHQYLPAQPITSYDLCYLPRHLRLRTILPPLLPLPRHLDHPLNRQMVIEHGVRALGLVTKNSERFGLIDASRLNVMACWCLIEVEIRSILPLYNHRILQQRLLQQRRGRAIWIFSCFRTNLPQSS